MPEPAPAKMIDFEGSNGGLKVEVLRTAARRGEPGPRDERYDVAVPKKSP
jgi:hypothetical protein